MTQQTVFMGLTSDLCAHREVGLNMGTLDDLVARWEFAYGEYLKVANLPASTDGVRQELSQRSAKVATAWRELVAGTRLEWWAQAASLTAAEAFEQQASQFAGPPLPSPRPRPIAGWSTGTRLALSDNDQLRREAWGGTDV